MKIAYLVNMYPKVSHTFIRREILALERLGCAIERFSVRQSGEQLVDEQDCRERQRTRTLLDGSAWLMLFQAMRIALRRPRRFTSAVRLAWQIGTRSDRGHLVNLIYLIEACTLLRWCDESKVQHVHAHFGTNPAALAMLCRALGGPGYSFTVHGPGEFDRAPFLALEEKIDRATFVVAISEFGRSQLYRWCGWEQWSKIHVVRCGLDRSLLDQPPTAVPDTSSLVCVGRLCEQKGQLLLLEAARRLFERGVDFHLLLVGDGEMRPEVSGRIERFELKNHVSVTGWATGDQVEQYIRDCRGMVLPSFAEGLPVVIMEALALGRPVISTYVAGIPELVRDGENGWLVPAGSVDALCSALERALQTSVEGLTGMGQEGVGRVRDMHDIEKEAVKLHALISGDEQAEPTTHDADAMDAACPDAGPTIGLTNATHQR